MEKYAKTPEQLMRSRYSAYATKNSHYIFTTYAKKSQPLQNIEEIASWMQATSWLSLKINHCSSLIEKNITNAYPTVSFTATYLEGKNLCEMSETSRFIKEGKYWYYLDGNVNKQVSLGEIKRNNACPCNSLKKFKQCCGR